MGEILFAAEQRRLLYGGIDVRRQHITPETAQRRRQPFGGGGLFDYAEHFRQSPFAPALFDDGVLDRLFGRALLHAEDAFARPFVGVDELRETGASAVVDDDIVAVHDRERLVAREVPREHDRGSRAARVALDGVAEFHRPRELVELALRHAFGLARAEVLPYHLFFGADDDEHFFYAAVRRLLDDVMERRLVDDREHLLGHRLGDGQEPRPVPRRGYDRFPDLLHDFLLSLLIFYTLRGYFAMRVRILRSVPRRKRNKISFSAHTDDKCLLDACKPREGRV